MLTDIIGNTVEAVVNNFHILVGDQDVVTRVFESYLESKCDNALRFMITEPTVFTTYAKAAWEWADRSIADVTRSAHNEWVRSRVIALIYREMGRV